MQRLPARFAVAVAPADSGTRAGVEGVAEEKLDLMLDRLSGRQFLLQAR